MAIIMIKPSVFATDEYTYGFIEIISSDINEAGDEYIVFSAYDTSGNENEYSCANTVMVNGRSYNDASEIFDALAENSYARFVTENEKIISIDWDITPNTLINVSYDTENNKFVDIEANPIYYTNIYNEYIDPYLDGNHKYDIKVYDYGIQIFNMTASDKSETIKYIDKFSGINSNFEQFMEIGCYVTGGKTLKLQLYDENNLLIKEQAIEAVAGEWSVGEFYGLPNETNRYIFKIWLEDIQGIIVSPVYTKEYLTNEIYVREVTFKNKVIESDPWGNNDTIIVQIEDADGEIYVVNCAEQTYVNGEIYSLFNGDAPALYNIIPKGFSARIAVINNEISAINFIPVQVKSAKSILENEQNKAEIEFDYVKTDGVLFVAIYDENHCLAEIKQLDLVANTLKYYTPVSFEIDNKNYTARLFIFYDDITPIVESIPII